MGRRQRRAGHRLGPGTVAPIDDPGQELVVTRIGDIEREREGLALPDGRWTGKDRRHGDVVHRDGERLGVDGAVGVGHHHDHVEARRTVDRGEAELSGQRVDAGAVGRGEKAVPQVRSGVLVVPADGREGDGGSLVYGHVTDGIEDRRGVVLVVDAHIDRDQDGIARERTVGHPIGEAVIADKIRVRRIGDRAVLVDLDRAARRLACDDRRNRVSVRVAVIVEDGDGDRHTLVGRGRVRRAARRGVVLPHGHGDPGRIARQRAVGQPVGEGVCPEEAAPRRVGHGAVGIEHERALDRRRHHGDRHGIAVGIVVVGQDVDRRGHVSRRVLRIVDGNRAAVARRDLESRDEVVAGRAVTVAVECGAARDAERGIAADECERVGVEWQEAAVGRETEAAPVAVEGDGSRNLAGRRSGQDKVASALPCDRFDKGRIEGRVEADVDTVGRRHDARDTQIARRERGDGHRLGGEGAFLGRQCRGDRVVPGRLVDMVRGEARPGDDLRVAAVAPVDRPELQRVVARVVHGKRDRVDRAGIDRRDAGEGRHGGNVQDVDGEGACRGEPGRVGDGDRRRETGRTVARGPGEQTGHGIDGRTGRAVQQAEAKVRRNVFLVGRRQLDGDRIAFVDGLRRHRIEHRQGSQIEADIVDRDRGVESTEAEKVEGQEMCIGAVDRRKIDRNLDRTAAGRQCITRCGNARDTHAIGEEDGAVGLDVEERVRSGQAGQGSGRQGTVGLVYQRNLESVGRLTGGGAEGEIVDGEAQLGGIGGNEEALRQFREEATVLVEDRLSAGDVHGARDVPAKARIPGVGDVEIPVQQRGVWPERIGRQG